MSTARMNMFPNYCQLFSRKLTQQISSRRRSRTRVWTHLGTCSGMRMTRLTRSRFLCMRRGPAPRAKAGAWGAVSCLLPRVLAQPGSLCNSVSVL